MSKRPGVLARAALSLSLAGVALGATAQVAPPAGAKMYFEFSENFISTQYFGAAANTPKYFHFDVPAGATHVRVETHASAGQPNVAFTVKEGASGYAVRCANDASDKPVSSCGFEPAPGRYFIEVNSVVAYDEIALIASVLPEAKAIASLVDQPYQLGRRAAYSTDRYDTPHCVESRNAVGSTLPAATCMPMGNPQQWRFEPHGGDFLVRNVHSNACLAPQSRAIGASVREGACDAGNPTHLWDLSAPAGATHYTTLRNADSGLCLDFAGGHATQVVCTPGSPANPAFDLRDPNKRWKPQGDLGGAISVVRGGLCAARVGDAAALGDCRDANASGLFFVESEAGGPWGGAFHAMSISDGRCMAQLDATDGHRYAVFNDCDTRNPGHAWTLVPSGDTAWEFRNLQTGECLNAKGGASGPGTQLITWTCTPPSDNARWHWSLH